jgi:hypothetical protein
LVSAVLKITRVVDGALGKIKLVPDHLGVLAPCLFPAMRIASQRELFDQVARCGRCSRVISTRRSPRRATFPYFVSLEVQSDLLRTARGGPPPGMGR